MPLIALIGRPNVGKSTLFNRLIRGNRAVTHDRPGVTRDRMYGEVRREGIRFRIVDTGGIGIDEETGPAGLRGFEREVFEQAQAAMAEADVLALVVDGRDGLTTLDEELADMLRQSSKPVLLVVNKVDGMERADYLTAEFHALGFEPLPVSSAHGFNIRELVRRIGELLPQEEVTQAERDEEPTDALFEIEAPETEEIDASDIGSEEIGADAIDAAAEVIEAAARAEADAETPGEEAFDDKLRLALLGRPNAGKSSIVNALCGEKRMIVSEIPGTTRDSVDVTVDLDWAGDLKQCTFVDTAGVRRRTKITDQVERYSVNAALKSAAKADVAVFVLDAMEGVSTQDKKLLAYLDREKLPFIVVVNKLDLIPREKVAPLKRAYKDALRICPHVPILYVSALKRKGLRRIVLESVEVRRESGKRVPTAQLNKALVQAVNRHQPPVIKRRRAKFYYMTQTSVHPPTFVVFVNDPERVRASYVRYLENQLRKIFDMGRAPMRFYYRPAHTKRS